MNNFRKFIYYKIWIKIKNFFLNIYNIIRWIPILWKDREWDYAFMLKIEQKKLMNMIKWYETNNYGHTTAGPSTVRQMKLAVNLLDIILENDDWWHIDYPENYKFVVDHKFQPLPISSFVIEKYVNTRNYKRFFPWMSDNAMQRPSLVIELRKQKAWCLYHKLREQYMMHWWD